ncbi:alcohol dehydrogenase [Aspergillus steynii IBT 23096]|uniref:D-xylulose reductase n=1 Tax=Aspergillus steynii IBT 23096 TaxID=1392250 RepID=A0A2I2GD49_9EURO|nr:alcohol dehydrogenase [Aspergillus steynii IBT 23096]PLB50826.1 alcohol dehydrogenase [Aspergillus steynii IBT 23096]
MSTSLSAMQNPSCLLYGAGDCRYEDRPIPSIQDSHDVIIRIAYTGVCGSDVAFWTKGGFKRLITTSNPVVMGHEASGTVHAVGSAITHLRIGDPVAIEPGYACRRCELCKAGRYNLCPRMKFAAVPRSADGTLARFFKIPGDYCHSLVGEGGGTVLGLDEAVLMEPLAVAIHSVRSVGVKPGDRVVVFGSGTVGLLCASVAREFAAKQVVMVDVNASKLEFAQSVVPNVSVSFGTYIPSSTLSAEENASKILEQFDTPSHVAGDAIPGFDIAIEATGAEPCVQMGIHVLRPGGAYIQTGNGKGSVEFPISTVGEKEIVVRGCFRYGPGDFQLGVRMASKGKIPVKKFITKVVPFDKAVEAWETTMRGEGIKTLIRGVEN